MPDPRQQLAQMLMQANMPNNPAAPPGQPNALNYIPQDWRKGGWGQPPPPAVTMDDILKLLEEQKKAAPPFMGPPMPGGEEVTNPFGGPPQFGPRMGQFGPPMPPGYLPPSQPMPAPSMTPGPIPGAPPGERELPPRRRYGPGQLI